jgi:hypothetical protein
MSKVYLYGDGEGGDNKRLIFEDFGGKLGIYCQLAV